MPPPAPTAPTDLPALEAICAAHGLTPAEFAALREHAHAAKASAYCPYSGFRVGAALLTASASASASASTGEIVRGANVENASYPVTTCAERVALGTAVVAGHRAFRAVAVATDVSPPASPCGMCRQSIREFCDLTVPIIMFDKDSNFVVMTLDELLPLSFGPESLGVPGPPKAA
ncbi:cytidine deaminase [Trichocladium antarcticum]|uniref:Cytidine deaminase n=1 Tax=Trichocladium antarcticum TaxID=1450529 RepID=A0AAN6ZET9_9PEZI|nr:cytidine deaminase [Trichocladium antarcticum]